MLQQAYALEKYFGCGVTVCDVGVNNINKKLSQKYFCDSFFVCREALKRNIFLCAFFY